MPLTDLIKRDRPVRSYEDQPEDIRKLVEKIVKRFDSEMNPHHRDWRAKWDDLDRMYHRYEVHHRNRSRDRDSATGGVILGDMADWQTRLHIPVAYWTIETCVPRVVSQRPRLIAKPRNAEAEPHRKMLEDLQNQQLADIDYELKLQPTVRRALKFGLGVQALRWREQKRKVAQWVENEAGQLEVGMTETVLQRGPYFEDVDIFDWFFDPRARSIETCEDILYRTFRSTEYVMEKIKSGEWFEIDEDTVKGLEGAGQSTTDSSDARYEHQGISSYNAQRNTGHEVWEYHKQGRVTTILGRQYVVADDTNPFFHREFPFQIVRPTMVEGQIPGIGEIEPLEQLIAELNTLRSQRRDNIAAIINRSYFYQRGTLEKKDIKLGPGNFMGVRGVPREAIFPVPTEDIPSSAFGDEQTLMQNIDTTSGISDPVTGAESQTSETATEVQLVQSAANIRIAMKARMLLLELIKPAARQQHELNKQHLLPINAEQRFDSTTVRIDDAAAQDGYRFAEITPETLQAEVDWEPEEHSTEPENRQQRINDSLSLLESVGQHADIVDRREPIRHVLEAYDIRNIEQWMIPEQVQLNPEIASVVGQKIAETMLAMGFDEEGAQNVSMAVLGAVMEATGVSTPDGVPPEDPEAAQANGAGPVPAPQSQT